MNTESSKTITFEIDRNLANVCIATIVAITLVTVVYISTAFYTQRMQTAMERGYEEGKLPGCGETLWIKVHGK